MELLHKLRVPVGAQAVFFRTLARLGFHLHPRDAELVGRFRSHRKAFDGIRMMLLEDSHLGYVGFEKTRLIGENAWRPPKNPGITQERWNRYKALLEEVGARAASHVGDTVTLRMSTSGSSSKGIVHSPAHRVVVVDLERYPLPAQRHAHLVLDAGWYVYYGWDS